MDVHTDIVHILHAYYIIPLHLLDEALHKFDVALSNTSPSVLSPTLKNYDLIRHIEDPAGMIVSLNCTQPPCIGRHVIIHMTALLQVSLELSEVEVYGGKLSSH